MRLGGNVGHCERRCAHAFRDRGSWTVPCAIHDRLCYLVTARIECHLHSKCVSVLLGQLFLVFLLWRSVQGEIFSACNAEQRSFSWKRRRICFSAWKVSGRCPSQ